MSDLNLERTSLKIENLRVLDFFMDGQRARLLGPFLGRPCSIAEAAHKSGEGLKKMGYWVERFVEYGLLRQVTPAVSRRAATYQTTATHFVLEDLDSLLLRDYIREQFDPLWQNFMENVYLDSRKYAEQWDFHVFQDEQGNLVREFAPAWDRAHYRFNTQAVTGAAINSWALLPLKREDAQEFMSRLKELLAEHVQKADHSPQAKLYLIHVGVVPHDLETD